VQLSERTVDVHTTVGVPAAADHLPLVPVAAPDPPLVARRMAPDLGALRLVAAAGRSAAVVMAIVVPYAAMRPLTFEGAVAVGTLAAVWLASLGTSRAAPPAMLSVVPTIGIGSAAGLIAIAALDPWFPGLQLGPLAIITIGAGIFASMLVWEAAVRRTSIGRRRVLVIGNDDVAEVMAEELQRTRVRDMELVAHVVDGESDGPVAAEPLHGGLADLVPIVEAQRPDLVVLTDDATYADSLDRLLEVPAPRFRVVGFAGFFEHVFGRVPIDQITPAWFLSLLHPRQRIYTRLSKRIFDVLVAGLGLLVVAPLLPVLALLTRTTPGPVLYRQTRVGECGKPFTIYKFRTMEPDAERAGPALAPDDDPRATAVGRVLRRTHLDELPQLWNVLKGDMSIVGPRPERPEFIALLEGAVPFWNRRLLVKPGITGWAQVRCEHGVDRDAMAKKLSYDLWYLRHRSLLVDFAICAITFGEVLRRSRRAMVSLRR
jgi:exopolysaccharide biosynthesis polyprenyl glycosylphosphotransferase